MDPMPRSCQPVLRATILAGLCAALAGASCRRGEISAAGGAPSAEQLVKFYSPASIKILPFTKPRSFDDDAIPDGIGLSLRPLDAAGDPVKAYGTFIFELYEYRPALGTHRGALLQTWTQPVSSPEDQRKFWERVTSTYEFQLSWEGRPIPPQKKHIIVASFQAAGGERLFDEYEFESRLSPEDLGAAVGAAPSP
jgi:hypothetical protein